MNLDCGFSVGFCLKSASDYMLLKSLYFFQDRRDNLTVT
jgi:hypothetical protein